MVEAFEARGIKFRIGKYRVRIWWTLIEYSDGMFGRYHFFPWWRLAAWYFRKKS